MTKVEAVKKMQTHATDVAGKIGELIDAWADLLIISNVMKEDERDALAKELEHNADAMADTMRLLRDLQLEPDTTFQVFSAATFLKHELITFVLASPETMLKRKKKR